MLLEVLALFDGQSSVSFKFIWRYGHSFHSKIWSLLNTNSDFIHGVEVQKKSFIDTYQIGSEIEQTDNRLFNDTFCVK